MISVIVQVEGSGLVSKVGDVIQNELIRSTDQAVRVGRQRVFDLYWGRKERTISTKYVSTVDGDVGSLDVAALTETERAENHRVLSHVITITPAQITSKLVLEGDYVRPSVV